MSVKDKITDAKILYKNGRKEGALLSVLIAVAATARKRYPLGTKKDSDAFTCFLAEELPKVINARELYIKFRNEMILLQDFLYKYVRCTLTHEAILPNDIFFEKGKKGSLTVAVDPHKITFSDNLIDILSATVFNAEENKNELKGINSNR